MLLYRATYSTASTFQSFRDGFCWRLLWTRSWWRIVAWYQSEVWSILVDSSAHCRNHDELPQKGECFIHRASDVAPNSRDLNPVNYAVWGAPQQQVYHNRSQRFIDRSIDKWRRRLTSIVQQHGGHTEHTVWIINNAFVKFGKLWCFAVYLTLYWSSWKGVSHFRPSCMYKCCPLTLTQARSHFLHWSLTLWTIVCLKSALHKSLVQLIQVTYLASCTRSFMQSQILQANQAVRRP